MQKLEGSPESKTVVILVEVAITAIVGYYWLVDSQESSIPGELEQDGILNIKKINSNS